MSAKRTASRHDFRDIETDAMLDKVVISTQSIDGFQQHHVLTVETARAHVARVQDAIDKATSYGKRRHLFNRIAKGSIINVRV